MALSAALIYLGLRGALALLGVSAVRFLQDRPFHTLLVPSLFFLLAFLLLLFGAFLWSRAPRSTGRTALFGFVLASLAVGDWVLLYDIDPAGHFYGLRTFAPHQKLVDNVPHRPKLPFRVNAHGLRGPDFALRKAEGVTRIALAGDSFVFGIGVRDDETLAVRLGETLRTLRTDRPFEVLNLGMPGHNLRSHLDVLEIAQTQLDADVLVLCLTLPGDLSSWDTQERSRSQLRPSGFALMSHVFGTDLADRVWTALFLARSLSGTATRVLSEGIERLRLTRTALAPPLLVFAYSQSVPEVQSAFATLPRTTTLPAAPFAPEFYLPHDGHPTPAGNRYFAGILAPAALQALGLPCLKP
jgi:hypothetical protein